MESDSKSKHQQLPNKKQNNSTKSNNFEIPNILKLSDQHWRASKAVQTISGQLTALQDFHLGVKTNLPIGLSTEQVCSVVKFPKIDKQNGMLLKWGESESFGKRDQSRNGPSRPITDSRHPNE